MRYDSVEALSGSTVKAPSPYASGPDAPSNEIGKDQFLKLLVAQLKYQDPLDPSSSEEFISTTAQFTVVEKLDELTKQGENTALVNSLTTASSLIGREVTANQDGVTVTAVVSQSRIVSGAVLLDTPSGSIRLDQIVSVGAPTVSAVDASSTAAGNPDGSSEAVANETEAPSSDPKSTADGSEPVADEIDAATDAGEPAVDDSQPATDGGDPAIEDADPTGRSTAGSPADGGGSATGDNAEVVAPRTEPAASSAEAAVSDSEPVVSNAAPTNGDGDAATDDSEPATDIAEPELDTEPTDPGATTARASASANGNAGEPSGNPLPAPSTSPATEPNETAPGIASSPAEAAPEAGATSPVAPEPDDISVTPESGETVPEEVTDPFDPFDPLG